MAGAGPSSSSDAGRRSVINERRPAICSSSWPTAPAPLHSSVRRRAGRSATIEGSVRTQAARLADDDRLQPRLGNVAAIRVLLARQPGDRELVATRCAGGPPDLVAELELAGQRTPEGWRA